MIHESPPKQVGVILEVHLFAGHFKRFLKPDLPAPEVWNSPSMMAFGPRS